MLGRVSNNSLLSLPKYLSMPAVGVDISDRSVKFLELKRARGYMRVGVYGEYDLEPSVVEDGRIVSIDKLSGTLKKIKDLGVDFVRAALPEEQIYFFKARVLGGQRSEIYNSIELIIEEHVPIPASETIFDFEIVGTSGAEVDVVVTAASQSVVSGYVEVFKQAGLTLLSLELEAEAIARAIIPKDDNGVHMIVDFGRMRTGISVVKNGAVHFSSTISMGGQTLTETLVKNFNISVEEAEKMKRDYGMRRNSPRQDLFAILLNNVAVLRDEINKHFVYWHTHNDEGGIARAPIEQIVLVGGDSNLAGLADYLSSSLKVSTIVPNVWETVPMDENTVPPITKNDSLGYATAVGLALYEIE